MRGRLLVIFMVLCVLTASAETHYKPHISLGARAGASLAMMDFSPSVHQTWNQGTAGALTFRYTEEKLFALIAEIGWVQRGWKEDFQGLVPVSYSRSITYVDIPLLTHIYFGSRRFKAFVNLGPQICYKIGSSISADFDYKNPGLVEGFDSRRQTEQLWADITNDFDYGICGGIGFEFYVQPRHSLVLEGRYYFGLGNIFPANKASTFGASRCMSIEITLGYNFRIK